MTGLISYLKIGGGGSTTITGGRLKVDDGEKLPSCPVKRNASW